MTAGRTFPSGFLWGAATSAHQVEGNCTNNQWWAWEQEAGHIRDGAVSGIACDHYRAVCDSVRRHGMAPTVTLHHFTHPLWVARQGGWENPRIIDWLARFAERAA